MNMESNFDDTMFEVDEFDETPTPSNLETDPKPEKQTIRRLILLLQVKEIRKMI